VQGRSVEVAVCRVGRGFARAWGSQPVAVVNLESDVFALVASGEWRVERGEARPRGVWFLYLARPRVVHFFRDEIMSHFKPRGE
jgi:hypothetical protein